MTETNFARPKASPWLVLRSLLFMLWMYGLMAVLGVACSPLLLAPRRYTLALVKIWTRLVLGGLSLLIGVKVEVRGREHLPTGAALIAAKHQGMFDFIPPFLALPDPCFVLKKELMALPFFGWYAKKVGVISIDRSGGAKTLRTMTAEAKAALAAGRQIIIFPEGTRQDPGAAPDYKPGVAGLYRELEVPCVPAATTSGLVWPAHGVARYPGVAVFEYLEPIPPGLKRGEFMRLLEERIETAGAKLLGEQINPIT